MLTEYWHPVTGYEGAYEVSTLGQVRNIRSGRILKPGGGRYALVRLSHANHTVSRLLHRLVLQAFKGNAPRAMQANHRNGNTMDNRLENLEWVTASANAKHAFENALRIGRRGERNNWTRLTKAQVEAIRSARLFGEGQDSIAARFGINQSTVSRIVRRLRWNT